MKFEELIYRINIDYSGYYTEAETKETKPVLCLRCFIEGEPNVGYTKGRKYAVSLSSDPTNVLEDAIEDLNKRIKKWYNETYKEDVDLKDRLASSEDLKRKFNNWLSLAPNVIEKEKSIGAKL